MSCRKTSRCLDPLPLRYQPQPKSISRKLYLNWIKIVILKQKRNRNKHIPCRLPDNFRRWYWDWKRKKTNGKNDFYKKKNNFKLFNVILELNILLFRNETTRGPVSISISIRDGYLEQSSSNGYLKLGFMGLSRFYFWFRFLYCWLRSIWATAV